MFPTQRLQAIILANRPRVHGGMRGGFELMAAHGTPQFWKRSAAETLVTIRENRSACQALGWNYRRTAAIRLDTARLQIAMAKSLAELARIEAATPLLLAAE